jgi:hypothetical protein
MKEVELVRQFHERVNGLLETTMALEKVTGGKERLKEIAKQAAVELLEAAGCVGGCCILCESR